MKIMRMTRKLAPLVRKVSRDPYNKIGDFIYRELQANRVTYGYACNQKLSNRGVN